MTLPDHKFDFVDEMVGDLTSYLQKPKLRALVRVVAHEVQASEDLAWACIAERLVTTARGRQLDQWGKVLRERRDGLPDEEYRSFLQARILSNLSNGEPDRMSQILAILTKATSIFYQPLFPAGMAFDYAVPEDIPSRASLDRIMVQLQDVAGAGIAVYYITKAVAGSFGFAEDPDALGFDDGKLAEVV